MKCRIFLFVFLVLSFHGYGQSCNLSVNLSASNSVICSESAVTLTATPSGGTSPYTYVWNTGATTSSISVNKAATYTVTVKDNSGTCPAVSQSITVTSATSPNPPTASGAVVCQNSSATLTATGPGGNYQWYSAPTGGNFLASGATYTTPPIKTSSLFYVQTTVNTCTSSRTAVYVGVFSNPGVTGATICAGSVATLSATGGDTYQWYASSAAATSGGTVLSTSQDFTTPELTSTTTYYVVAMANGCSSAPTAVTATVTQTPTTPVASNTTVCSGASANLHASGTGGVVQWFNVPNGGTPLISSPDYTTPALTATTTYYVQAISGTDCTSDRVPVTVTVNPIPSAPVTQNATTCPGTSAMLTASGTGTYEWYSTEFSTKVLATGSTFTTPILNNTTTYYVADVSGGCPSTRSAATVTLSTAPSAPTAAGAIICSGYSAALQATAATGGTYQWYDAATGGNLLSSTNTYTTPNLTVTTTYYVETTISGCTSARTPVKVTVTPTPASPTAAGTTICYGSTATLTANGPSGEYDWYDAATGGNLLISGQVYVTPGLTATTTYYVQVTTASCASARTAVTVTVDPELTAPTASGTTICGGNTASLSASGSGTLQWYDAATGGNLLATGNNYTTPILVNTTTYYVLSTNGACNSARTAVTVTVIHVPNPQFQYPSGTVCSSGSNPIPNINNSAGGTFSASSGALVFVSTTTGEINVAASEVGSYVVFFTSNGTCGTTTSAKISIATTPDAQFSYAGPYCQDGINPLPTFQTGASAGVFSANSSGLVFIDNSTGEIDLSKSTAGTYTITNTIVANGGCPASTASASVTINQAVIISAGPDQTVLRGNPVQLAGSVKGAPGGTWSGGTGTFSNASAANAVYTPGPGENLATLTFTSDAPAAPCGPKAATVNITIRNTQPGAPTAPGTSICSGSTATLFATAPGGNYAWYSAAAGGNLLSSGPTFVTPVLTATTNYYVQTTVGGIASSRTQVTVTVNAIPAAPVASGQSVCMNSSATLIATGSPGSYEWYDAPTGGNILSQSNTYTTSNLIADTNFYVQSINNGCTSGRTMVSVQVTPVPVVTSAPSANICSNNALSDTLTANIATATYNWGRAAVAGISNPAVSNQTAGIITETLINTTDTAVNVTYVITPMANGCAGTPSNFIVTVYPNPVITSATAATICNGTTDNYAVTFNIPGTTFTWSRAAVAGISNAAVTGQAASTIREVLFNTTNAPVTANYLFSYQTNTCTGTPFNLAITVNPPVKITSAEADTVCSGTAQNYVITSNVSSATFVWGRIAVKGIKNPTVSNQTADTIAETLIDTIPSPVRVIYQITPAANNCQDSTFKDTVIVEPEPILPVANSNSPVCTASTIQLTTAVVSGATYLWTGPNGFSSTAQNPTIADATTANTGTYNLLVSSHNCASPLASVSVVVDALPVANAGTNQTVCSTVTAVALNGSVTGGTSTGVWSTNGTGTFSPSNSTLNAQYLPSAADKAADSVVLTLASTSNDDCAVSTSSITITFKPIPGVIAGPNQDVCSQDASVALNGQLLVPGGGLWTTSGTGTFSPSATQLNATYLSSAGDVQSGLITLTLHADNAGVCYIPTDTLQVKYIPPPIVNAGGIRYVLKNHTIVLTPTVSDGNVKYLWSPDVDINDDTLKNPTITGDIDRTYTLQVTDSRGCVSTDQTYIKVSPTLTVPNTFTPNGDGINDYWDIVGLVAYEDATVDIFNRYGIKLFHSVGYPKPWDGTFGGQPVPVGTYYYVINTHYQGLVLSGFVAVIR